MSLPIRFDPAASHELLEAAEFYDLERPGLGVEFLDELEAALKQLGDNPESCPVELGETRKLVLARFPYSVMYWIDASAIVVTAVAHQRRRPRYWGDRP